jgi:hypothetical protein
MPRSALRPPLSDRLPPRRLQRAIRKRQLLRGSEQALRAYRTGLVEQFSQKRREALFLLRNSIPHFKL